MAILDDTQVRPSQIDPLVARVPKESLQIVGSEYRHALVTGNCVKIMRVLPAGKVDLIITDPPYNIGLDYGVYHDRMKKTKFFNWCRKWLKECVRLLTENGTLYLISYPEINARLLTYVEDQLDLKLRRWLTWHYPTNIGHSKRNYTRSQRSILFFTKGNEYTFNRQEIIQPYKNPDVGKIKRRIESGTTGRVSYDALDSRDLLEIQLLKGETDFIEVNLLKNTAQERFDQEHPCQLPPTLLRILVKVSSNPNDILMDPFAGTFTLSAVAAELSRNSLGIEINPAYVRLGLERVKYGRPLQGTKRDVNIQMKTQQ